MKSIVSQVVKIRICLIYIGLFGQEHHITDLTDIFPKGGGEHTIQVRGSDRKENDLSKDENQEQG
jgi:hypothetical protein